MRSRFVVLAPPAGDGSTDIVQAKEPALAQAFVPILAVEALDVAVLNGLAGSDEVEADTARMRPVVEVLDVNSVPLSIVMTSGWARLCA